MDWLVALYSFLKKEVLRLRIFFFFTLYLCCDPVSRLREELVALASKMCPSKVAISIYNTNIR